MNAKKIRFLGFSSPLKQSRFLTAFQQDRNPLIQLNQDNIENTVKQRIMPPTLPTKKATIQ